MKTALVILTTLLTAVLHAAPPNVIVVITDDQGYGELSCHGNPVLRTPHLDRLHAESVRLTDFHVAPMCTPTRGQLLTGVDAARNGAINVSSGRTLLRPGIPTLADVFAAAGYRTGIFGKWHLGDNYPSRPQDRGFHEFLWFPSSHINSVPDRWDNDYFDDTYRHNGQHRQHRGYCTDLFFDEAIAWMKKQSAANKPFFTYLPTNAPHGPHWVPAEYRAAMEKEFAAAEKARKVPELKPPRRAALVSYLAMIRNIDDNLGKLESFLRENGLRENTILVFLTDNGSTFGPDYYNAGMRGRKTQLWEGGHRVPCFVRWPDGRIAGGNDVAGLTHVQDLFPTLCSLTGVPHRKTESQSGLDLAGALRGRQRVPADRMLVINYSRMPFGFDYPSPDAPSRMRRRGAAVLWKRWRLLEDRELYNLADDPRQQRNVIGRHPDVASRMRARLDAWWADAKDIANQPVRVVIGHEAENPSMLTACEWLDVFVDQQRQIRVAERKNGYWELEVARAGTYEFELRRWPREANLPMTASLPATEVTDGTLQPGAPLPVARARILINGVRQTKAVKPDDAAVTFTAELEAGPARLHTWFDDDRRQPICGAYYVYVNRN